MNIQKNYQEEKESLNTQYPDLVSDIDKKQAKKRERFNHDEVKKHGKSCENKVTNCPTISWQIIKGWQFNQLKDNSNRDVSKLVNSILNNGFIAPFDCWKNPNGKNYVFDGTGRMLALLQLETEGIEIPELPVLFIKAENIKEAKKYALHRSSQHGKITQNSLADFTSSDFELDELKELQLEELELYMLDVTLDNVTGDDLDIDFDNINSNQDREKKFKEQLVTCPHCNGKFNMQI
ncbi:MAG: ParB N-terminal domain-containing protein [Fusobacteriaceae bacterium]